MKGMLRNKEDGEVDVDDDDDLVLHGFPSHSHTWCDI